MGISRQRFNIILRELFDMRLIAKVGKRNKANVYAIAEEDYLYDFANHGVPADRRSVDGETVDRLRSVKRTGHRKGSKKSQREGKIDIPALTGERGCRGARSKVLTAQIFFSCSQHKPKTLTNKIHFISNHRQQHHNSAAITFFSFLTRRSK